MPLLIAAALLAASGLSVGGKADAGAIQRARDEAARHSLADVEILAHSTALRRDGRPVGEIVLGRAKLPRPGVFWDMTCFVAFTSNRRLAFVTTLGTGNWEAEFCRGVRAVGLVPPRAGTRLAIIYDGASPNTPTITPILLALDPEAGTLAIDEPASDRASIAGALTLGALRRLFR